MRLGSKKTDGMQDANTQEEWTRIVAAWSSEERAAKEKIFVRRIDKRLLPILIIMYIMNYIDRNALPQARVQGLEDDIGLQGVEYNVALSVLFVGYVSMQIPSNMILGLVRPSWYLAACMVIWGIVSGCSGAVQNFGGLVAVRFFLGITEAPFFAGVAFLFSGWYTRKELGTRLGIFFCGAMLSGAFGGLFAAGIAAAFRNNSIESWRWLFIIEGIATVVFAVATGFIIPDWPGTTKWLSEEERALGVLRLVEDAGDEEEEISTSTALKMALTDYRVWLCILGQVCVQAVASLTNFLPTLVRNFGFSTIHTLLLTAPPYVVTAGICVLNTWNSDRTGNRSLHIVVPTLGAITGIIITLATTNIAARYFALFLMLPGTYACFQVSNAWMSSIAARPRKKRGIALALNNSFGNTALTWTPYLYPSSDGPRYVKAWSVNLALSAVLLISTVVLSFLLKKDNKKADGAAAQSFAIHSQNIGDEKGGHQHQLEETEMGNETVGPRLGGRNAGATARFQT